MFNQDGDNIGVEYFHSTMQAVDLAIDTVLNSGAEQLYDKYLMDKVKPYFMKKTQMDMQKATEFYSVKGDHKEYTKGIGYEGLK